MRFLRTILCRIFGCCDSISVHAAPIDQNEEVLMIFCRTECIRCGKWKEHALFFSENNEKLLTILSALEQEQARRKPGELEYRAIRAREPKS